MGGKNKGGWPGDIFPAQGLTFAEILYRDAINLKMPDPYDPKFLTQEFFKALAK